VVCVSGVVYDVIHDVPFVGTDESGNPVIFSGEVSEFYMYIGSGAIWC
jgi:hypothetical protein